MNTIIKALSLVSVLSTFSVSAHAIPDLTCVTGGFPTTSFILETKDEKTDLRVYNHNGAKYAPVYSGTVTPSDIDYIKKSGEFFTRIGDAFVIHFEKDECTISEDKYFRCSLKNPQEISGLKIKSVYLSTSESVDKIPDFEFTRTNVRLSLIEENPQTEYKLEMSYYDNDCAIIRK